MEVAHGISNLPDLTDLSRAKLSKSTHCCITIILRVSFEVNRKISMRYPGRYQAETWCKQLLIHSKERKNIGMVKLLPHYSFSVTLLRISSPETMLSDSLAYLEDLLPVSLSCEQSQHFEAHFSFFHPTLPNILLAMIR